MSRRRILWIGDACCQTGFARVTHSVVGRLVERNWDVSVLGINYRGDPHFYGYPIYPAGMTGDRLGINRLELLLKEIEPDVVLVNSDVWNVVKYLKELVDYPVIAYIPVDAPNIKPEYAINLNRVQVVTYTQFGLQEFVEAGFSGNIKVIPHGFAGANFKPIDKLTARKRVLPFPDTKLNEIFIVGNVNRNQPRKRLDLTMEYFAIWIRQHKIANAYLLLHCREKDIGWDIVQLAEYFGISDKVIVSQTNIDEELLCMVYNSLDIQVSTTLGEGWGLTHMEGIACGIPQLAPDWAGIGEWLKGSAYLVPVTSTCVSTGGINTVGGLVDKELFIEGLNLLYRNDMMRNKLSEASLRLSIDPKFDWECIVDSFESILTPVVEYQRMVA